MPTTDPTPAELIDIWQEAAAAVLALGESLDDEQWRAPSPCLGWSAGDVVAHVVDIEQILAGLPRPQHDVDTTALPHVRNDVGRVTELGVDYRRSHPRADVLAELRAVIGIRREQLLAAPEGQQVIGPFGNPTTMDRLLRIRILDIWVHEQDIRAAVGADGDWATRPARISMEQMLRGLPYAWARTAKAPAGTTVRVTVTGALDADVTVLSEPEGTGRVVDPDRPATVRLSADWPDAMRLFCGRIAVDDPGLRSRIALDGDPDLSAALLPALAITP